MNETEIQKLMMDALNKWGIETQITIWIEEMAELIKALAKRNRNINPSFDSQIEEELADVDICLDQAKLIYPYYVSFEVLHYSKDFEDTKKWVNSLSALIEVLTDNYSNKFTVCNRIADVNICLTRMKSKYPDYQIYKEKKLARLKRLMGVS